MPDVVSWLVVHHRRNLRLIAATVDTRLRLSDHLAHANWPALGRLRAVLLGVLDVLGVPAPAVPVVARLRSSDGPPDLALTLFNL